MGSEREELSLGFEGDGQDQSSFLAFDATGLETEATGGFHRIPTHQKSHLCSL